MSSRSMTPSTGALTMMSWFGGRTTRAGEARPAIAAGWSNLRTVTPETASGLAKRRTRRRAQLQWRTEAGRRRGARQELRTRERAPGAFETWENSTVTAMTGAAEIRRRSAARRAISCGAGEVRAPRGATYNDWVSGCGRPPAFPAAPPRDRRRGEPRFPTRGRR